MENKKTSGTQLSRRKFLGNTAALAALSVVPASLVSAASSAAPAGANEKPNSKFGGVQIGAITYSWRSMPGGVENVIKYCKESGISSIELMSGDVEDYLGAPKNPMAGMFGPPPARPAAAAPAAGAPPPPPPPPAAPAGPPQRRELTDEQKAAVAKFNEDLKKWRLSLPMSKFEEVKKLFSNAGIGIHIVKFSPARWSDEEIDYAFKAAKALGAKDASLVRYQTSGDVSGDNTSVVGYAGIIIQ